MAAEFVATEVIGDVYMRSGREPDAIPFVIWTTLSRSRSATTSALCPRTTSSSSTAAT